MRGEGARGNDWEEEGPTRLQPSTQLEAPTWLAERRAAERCQIEVEVSLGSESQFFAGLSGDISTGGLFVQTYRLRDVGSLVLLAFSLPTGEIRTHGVVRWIRRAAEGTTPGMGIGFEGLLSDERDAIEAFCKTRPPLYHDLESD